MKPHIPITANSELKKTQGKVATPEDARIGRFEDIPIRVSIHVLVITVKTE